MRSLVGIIFLCIFSLQTFAGSFIVADYLIRKADYLRNCENKKRPALKCAGKCQMKKKLQKAEGNEEFPLKKFENKKSDYSAQSYFSRPLMLQPKASLIFAIFNNCSTICRANEIFHPPAAALFIA